MSTQSQMPPTTLTHYLPFNLEEALKEKELRHEARLGQVVALFLRLGSDFPGCYTWQLTVHYPDCKDLWVF